MRVLVDICDGKTTDYSTALVPEVSGGTDMLPLIIGAGVLLILAGAALFLQRRKAPRLSSSFQGCRISFQPQPP